MEPELREIPHDSTQQLLTPLRDSIIEKPPYISGKLQLPDTCFSLLYRPTKDGHAATHINLANATPDELEQLTQACEPASFGVNKEDVMDETYRKAGKMDSEYFAPLLGLAHTDLLKIIRDYLLEGTQSKNNIKSELYKLNVYDQGSFFKPHVDTPRNGKMFGSLVVVFPTPHEGGALLLRHRGHEWTFDPSQELAAEHQPAIGYVAFFSDIEHEVSPVVSGHRITLTYNLYFDDDGPVSANDAVSEYLSSPLTRASNEGAFREAFNSLLANPEFLGDGGTLAFGLRHAYSIKNSLKHVYKALKGSDAVVYQSVRALGFEPVLYMYYETASSHSSSTLKSALIDKVLNFSSVYFEDDVVDITKAVRQNGGIAVGKEGWEDEDDEMVEETVEWVTPLATFNRKESAFATLTYGLTTELNVAYGDVCLVVRIGKVGNRLAYPRVSQKAAHDEDEEDEDEEDGEDEEDKEAYGSESGSGSGPGSKSEKDSPPIDVGQNARRYGRGVENVWIT